MTDTFNHLTDYFFTCPNCGAMIEVQVDYYSDDVVANPVCTECERTSEDSDPETF